ncbi:MAG TPA: hypothetical protein VII93_00675 [Anaerolineales bacterium]
MNKKILISLLSIILAACTVKPTQAPTASAPYMDAEEQSIYAAVLQKLYAASNYVIMDTTATGLMGTQDMSSTLDHVLLNMHNFAMETADSFRARNNAAYPLRPDMDIGAGYVLLTQNDKTQLFNQNQDGWQLFYEKYPDAPGITALSRVGFNHALDQALVYTGTQSQWLAGAGFYLLLKKVNGGWIIDQQVMTWIS